ncbi:MAG: hypothetical protein H7Z75_02690, partial [Ferruginibacter sp.]|nr:hypothetical protein [Cytophagales bacterium]
RLDFDLSQNALVACNKRLKIRRIDITEKEGGGLCNVYLKQNHEGSYVVYLNRENQGYDGSCAYPIRFKPNKEYIISSVSGDSSLEMSVFTNREGRIDSVSNQLGCLKED